MTPPLLRGVVMAPVRGDIFETGEFGERKSLDLIDGAGVLGGRGGAAQ